jgi:hypothetical protein
MKPFSSLSFKEEYRLTGTLCKDSIEQLLDLPEIDKAALISSVKEASVFIGEDTFTEVIKLLNIHRTHRKDFLLENMVVAKRKLEQIESEINSAIEYHNECLKHVIKVVEDGDN